MWFRIGGKRHEPFDFFHDCIHEAIGDAALEALDIEPENFYPKSVTFPNRNVEADDRIVYDAESDKALLDNYPAAQIYFSEDVIHTEMLAGFWNVFPGIGLREIFNKKELYRMARNIMSELDILTSKEKTAFASAAPELISSLRKYNRPNDPVMRHALEILAG